MVKSLELRGSLRPIGYNMSTMGRSHLVGTQYPEVDPKRGIPLIIRWLSQFSQDFRLYS